MHFGELDASLEAIKTPELLLAGYFDFREAAYRISTGSAWVLLGPKGAGKSAVLEHMRLKWEGMDNRFFTYWELDTFPVQDVSRIGPLAVTESQRTQSAWEFLLHLKIYESIAMANDRQDTNAFDRVLDDLQRAGHLGQDLRSMVTNATGSSAGLDFRAIKGSRTWSSERPTLLDIQNLLREGLCSLRLSSRHIIALDGLDIFFFEGGTGWQSLASLVDCIASLNRFLLEARLPVSVVMTLRSDHFDSLNSQNSNKLKTHTVFLDWSNQGYGRKNDLWSLVATKISAERPEVSDFATTYLSQKMYSPSFPSVAEYLLTYTRLLPRDIIALLDRVKEESPGVQPVSEDAAKRATKRYSQEYFVGEVMNNLAGVLPGDRAHAISAFRDALRAAPTRFFNLQYVANEVGTILEEEEVVALLRRAFEVGAIGISNATGKGPRHTDFVFRNVSGAAFTRRYDFVLHDALTRAWNRPWN